MTLNLVLVAPWGIWQSSDHRLIDPRTGELVDDYSIKHVSVSCADGTALITYTGIGSVKGIHISDWLRGVLRGKSRSLDDSFILIKELATRWISPISAGKYHLVFNVGAFLTGNAWLVQIGNHQLAADWRSLPPTPEFHTSAKRIEHEPIAVISGARDAVHQKDTALLARVVRRRPKKPTDFHGLLAGINRRASEHPQQGKWITPACVTAHMPPAGEPIETKMHGWESGEDRTVPIVFRGIDLTDSSQLLSERLKATAAQTEAELEEEFQRCWEESVRRGIKGEDGSFRGNGGQVA